jgi:AcrR family transcriptional regulator
MNHTATKTYHHGNLRAELIDTALAQLQAVGADSLSLRALARAIGVSQTAPYRHFEDKNELLAALATRGYRDLINALRAAGQAADTAPGSQLRAFAHCYVDYAVAKPELFKLMFGPSLEPPDLETELRAATRETYDLVRSIIRRGMESGDFLRQDVEYVTNAAWSSIHGLAILTIDSPELFERHIELHKQIDLGTNIFIAGMSSGTG